VQPVRYFDGHSLEGTSLEARLDAGRLVMRSADRRQHHAFQIADLRLRYRSRLGDRVDLGVEGKPDIRLVIEGPEAEVFLSPLLPHLISHEKAASRRAGVKIAAVLTGILAFAGLFVWQLENILMPFIPESTEQALGKSLVDGMVADFGGGCSTPAGEAALRHLKDRLEAGWREGRPIHLRVADSSEVNAFTLPGGQIVVLRGLLENAESPEELAGVIAHEMGHERHHHPMRGLIRALGFQVVGTLVTGSNVADAGKMLLAMSYSRHMETEADEEALALLKAARISPRPLARFFDRIAATEDLPASIKGFVGIFSSHPDSAARAARMRAAPDVVAGPPVLAPDDWLALKSICKKAS